jgi:hypothetical protein
MTICAGMLCTDGIVLCADTLESVGSVHRPVEKLVAPILAYIVDVVKNNSPYCGRATSLAVLHANGDVEHKTQDYITKTTQGYKSIGWLLDTWVFPFLPLFVSEAGEDVLSMIGKLGEPKTDWSEKIPGILKFLKDRKDLIVAGTILAIPETQKQKTAFNGIPFSARILQNSSKQLYEQHLIGEETKESLNARCAAILKLSEIIEAAIASEIDPGLIKEMIERICLLFTASPSTNQSILETSEDQL